MIQYGSGPDTDEFEVMVFGPGYGEAIAVHFGKNSWLLVDSCIDPDRKVPASLGYLNAIGVGDDGVKIIVASHWHDDHVRGISTMAATYLNADVFIPAVFTNKEALGFLAAYSGAAAPKLTRGATELYNVVSNRDIVHAAQERTNIGEFSIDSRTIRITSLSPSSQAFSQSVAHLASYLPTSGAPINHAPELKPNLESIVVHVDFDGDSILLGSDLESTNSLGWHTLVNDSWCGTRRQSTLYKVAHHGSETGDHPGIWSQLLLPEPALALTPFTNANQRLPTVGDVARIKAHSSQAYISSSSTRRPEMDSLQLKRLNDICSSVARVNSAFGAIRLRKKRGQSAWSVQLLGAAAQM